MRDSGPLAQIRAVYTESRPLHRASLIVSVFFFLWMISGLSGLLIMGEPVWMYTGRGTTITHFFPFLIRYVTDVNVNGEHEKIVTNVGLPLDKVSWITYVLALAFVLTLVFLWLPIIPQVFGSENLRDAAVGFMSLLMFVFLLLCVLEDGKSFGSATDFNEQVERYGLLSRETGLRWTWEEYVEYAGIHGNSDYQNYIGASLLLFMLIAVIFTSSIFGMLLSSKQDVTRPIGIADRYDRGLRNINLVLAILFAAATITAFLSLLPFTQNADVLPGVPMFALLILMSGASFIEWKQFYSLDQKEEESSLGFWVIIFLFAQIAFLIVSLFFGENFLAA